MRTRHNRRGAAGLTLIELLVALGLVGVVLAAAGTMLFQAYASEAAYREQNTAQQNARTAADIVSDDLRGAARPMIGSPLKPDPNPANTVTIQANPPNSPGQTTPIYFNVNDEDGSDETQKRVLYWLDGMNLMREVSTNTALATGTSGVVVARNISTLTALKPYAPPNYNVVRIVVTASNGDRDSNGALITANDPTVQVDVTLRNNLLF